MTLRSLRIPVSLAVVLAGACTSSAPSAPSTPSRQQAPPSVSADRELEARSVLLLLADRRTYDERSLETFLGEGPHVREALAVALGRIGDARGRSLLQGLLVDTVPDVRRAAAFALGELGLREAERALVVAAVDDDPELGLLAVEALGKIGAPLATVRRALSAIDGEEGWRRLAPPLFRFKEPATVDAALEALASHPKGGPTPDLVRRGAAYGLAREPQPQGLDALRGLLTDLDPSIRAWAARGVGIAGSLDDLARLLPLLDDRSSSPRIQAMRAGSALLGRNEALPPLAWGEKLAALARAESPAVRAAALEAAGAFLPSPELEGELRAKWAAAEPRERDLALAALVAGRVEDRALLVAAAANAPERTLRARAAEAAARIGDAALAQRLLSDPEAAVRVAAAGSLAELGERAALLTALRDRDPAVRATALEALGDAAELTTADVVAAIDAARADGAQNDVRITGVRVLLARAKSSPAESARIVESLDRLGTDPDWLVRRETGKALDELGQPRAELGPIDTRRDLAAYREVLRQTEAPVRLELTTDRGSLTLELACREAPTTCLSFLQLARRGYFDGTLWHRVVPDFVAQGGDPRGDGWGGPGYTLRDEVNRLRFERGAVGMALSGPDTGGSQFFIALAPQPHLDGHFTVFGRVTNGMEVVDQLRQGDRIVSVREPGTGQTGGHGAAAGPRTLR